MTQFGFLNVKVVTPEKLFFSGVADMVIIPGSDGELGILPKHASLITMLKSGVLKIYTGDNISSIFLISHGYGQVLANEILILTEHALDIKAIKAQEVKDHISTLQDELTETQEDAKIKLIKKEISRYSLALEYIEK